MAVNYKSYEFRVYEHISQLDKLLQTKEEFGENLDELKQLQSEIAKLREDFEARKFRVAVVGEFNRGKTSFVNALLGRKILPADYIPTTAAINRITYGDTPDSYIIMKNGKRKTIRIDELAEYVTKLSDASAENASQVQEAVVEYPSLFCRNGVDLIDTPGMNDEESMNMVTISRLEEIDLAIVAVDASMPFSMTECAFTAGLLESPQVCQIVIVITKIDMIRERERQKMIDFMTGRVRDDVKEYLGKKNAPDSEIMKKYHAIFDEPLVYAVSSLDALEAVSCNNMELFEKSGFLHLNNDLPKIIMSSQNNNVILNTERVLCGILQKFRDRMLRQKERRRQLIPAMDEMKKDFAQSCYESASQVFEFPDEKAALFFPDVEKELEVIRKNFIQALGKMQELSMKELTRVFSPMMKEHFGTLNARYHANEAACLEKYQKNIVIPCKEELRQKLEALLRPVFPKLYKNVESEFEEFFDCFELAENGRNDEEEESFYWERSPIPPASVIGRDWNVMPYVDAALRFDLQSYQNRRFRQIKQSFMFSQQRLDAQAQKLVRILFAKIAEYEERLNAEEEDKFVMDNLLRLERDSRELREKFLAETGL